LKARDVGGNGFEFAAVLGGGVGLGVPGVLLRGAAPHEKEDTGFGPRPGGGPRLEELRQAEAAQREPAGAEELAAPHRGGGEERSAGGRRHGGYCTAPRAIPTARRSAVRAALWAVPRAGSPPRAGCP